MEGDSYHGSGHIEKRFLEQGDEQRCLGSVSCCNRMRGSEDKRELLYRCRCENHRKTADKNSRLAIMWELTKMRWSGAMPLTIGVVTCGGQKTGENNYKLNDLFYHRYRGK